MIESNKRSSVVALAVILMVMIGIVGLMVIMTSCTLSFQNINTHGKAEDLIDEHLQTEAEVSPDVSLPII